MVPPRFQQGALRFHQSSSGFVVCLVLRGSNSKGVGVELLSDCLWFSGAKLPIFRLDQCK